MPEFIFFAKVRTQTFLRKQAQYQFRINVLHITKYLPSKIQDQFRSHQTGPNVSNVQYNVNVNLIGKNEGAKNLGALK